MRGIPAPCHSFPMVPEAVESSGFAFRVRPDGILEIRARAGSVHDGDRAEINARILKGYGETGDRPVLLVIDGIRELTREARLIYRSPDTTKNVLAAALVARSPLARLFASFALGVNRPDVPIRIFEDEEEAVKWLKGYL